MSIEKLEEYCCHNGMKCCCVRIIPYECKNVPYITSLKKLKKAGSFIYDSSKRKVLLVQSRGQLWGPPKGSIQPEEVPLQCALREVTEETGIVLNEQQFSGSIVIKSKALYYITDTEVENYINIMPQYQVTDNDANGIGWFDIDCIDYWIAKGFDFNNHTRILLKKILNKKIIDNNNLLSNSTNTSISTVSASVTAANQDQHQQDETNTQ
jgi:hypothetical protein